MFQAVLVLGAAATMQAAMSHTPVDPEQARAQGYAQAKRNLMGPQTQAAQQSVRTPQTAGGQQSLALTCFGGGTADHSSVVMVNSDTQYSGSVGTDLVSGTGSGTSTMLIPRSEQFTDQTDLNLFGGDDRIRLPHAILMFFHGGSGGWFKLKHVVTDARTIRAEAAVNFVDHPKVYIDRVTGAISIHGWQGNYSGQCQAVSPGAAARF